MFKRIRIPILVYNSKTRVKKYADLSKWGRLRARPVDNTASNKEWQRSKFVEAKAEQQILGTVTGHNGAAPFYFKKSILLVTLSEFDNIYADVSKWS